MYTYGGRIYRNKYHYPKQHRYINFDNDKLTKAVQIAALVAEVIAFTLFLTLWFCCAL